MKIVTFDGGGVFGVGTVELFGNMNMSSNFDAFGGTSIGSALASWFALGYPIAGMADTMSDALTRVFTRSWYSKLNPLGPSWPSDELEAFARKHFSVPMKDAKKPLYIVSMDFSNRMPRVFSSAHDPDVLVADAVLASVSGPTYFKPRGGLVDGGIFANNPSVCTAAGICKQHGVGMDRMCVLSVGTGRYMRDPIDMSAADRWSLLQWAPKLINVMLAGSCEEGWHYIAKQMPFKAYARYNEVPLDANWAFDDTSIIPEIRRRAVARRPEFLAVVGDFMMRSNA